ncbi:MAG: aldo/keto reductase [Treponema sp.]|nr:aldo/keto reductase [Treponema sp.]
MAVTKRKIEKLGVDASLLGFGCMRFPTKDGKIDEERAEKMLDKAYEAGVNYFDTAWPYHGGTSEPFVGRVMKKYPRESFMFATKLPPWEIKTLEDAERIFKTQLEHLQSDYVDFYLMHAMGKDTWDRMRDLGVVELLEKYKKEGKIKYLGFSFHDAYPVFEEIINYRDWDFCQIQLNYMDVNEQAGMKGYELAEKLNVPIVIMEPVKGGSLANLPSEVVDPFVKLAKDASNASWALKWVASLPNVKVVLSGMSDEAQLEDNLKTFTGFVPFGEAENNAVKEVADAIRARVKNGCTGCRYCMPCPAGVDIPANFAMWNFSSMYNNKGHVTWVLNNQLKDGKTRADNCIKCGKCEKACPQQLKIRDDLEQVAKLIAECK